MVMDRGGGRSGEAEAPAATVCCHGQIYLPSYPVGPSSSERAGFGGPHNTLWPLTVAEIDHGLPSSPSIGSTERCADLTTTWEKVHSLMHGLLSSLVSPSVRYVPVGQALVFRPLSFQGLSGSAYVAVLGMPARLAVRFISALFPPLAGQPQPRDLKQLFLFFFWGGPWVCVVYMCLVDG